MSPGGYKVCVANIRRYETSGFNRLDVLSLCVLPAELWSWGFLLIAVWLDWSQTASHSLAFSVR